MYGASPYIEDDDDDVPPGFESRRGRLGAKQASAYQPPADDSYPVGYHPGAYQGTAMAAHHQPPHQYQQQRPSQLPAANGLGNYGYPQPPPPPPPPPPPAPAAVGRVSSGDLAAGGARQFQRALSGSFAAQQQPRSPRAHGNSPRHSSSSRNTCMPDYGEFNDSDTEYGAAPSSSGRRRNTTSKPNPRAGGGDTSSWAPAPHTGLASNYPQQQPQQQQRSLSASPGYGHGGSGTNLSSRPSGSYGNLQSCVQPPGLGPGRTSRGGAPLPPAAGAAPSPPGSTGGGPSPARHRPPAAAGPDGSCPADSLHAAQQRPSAAASPEPDYGEFDDGEEYGQETKGRRRQTRQGSGSSSRQRSGSRSSRVPAAASPTPEAAVAAATQALAGINPPQARTPQGGRRSSRKAVPRGGPLTAERTAVLEAELGALRARLAEAEAREVEAHMAVISLSSDNTSLQAQLSGMRQQKQQLEQMLLFGTDAPDSEDGDNYTSSSHSGQSDAAAEGDGHNGPRCLPDDEADTDEQLASLQGMANLPYTSQDTHLAAADSSRAGGVPHAAAVVGSSAGDLPLEIAEALAAAEAAGQAATGSTAPAGAVAGVTRSLSQEIAEALAAAEAAGDAAVAAGKAEAAAAAAPAAGAAAQAE